MDLDSQEMMIKYLKMCYPIKRFRVEGVRVRFKKGIKVFDKLYDLVHHHSKGSDNATDALSRVLTQVFGFSKVDISMAVAKHLKTKR